MRLKLTSYKASNNMDLCLAYQAGHIGILRNLGIQEVSSTREEWMNNPNMYFTLIYLENKVVGGARLQVKDPSTPLPIELAIDYLDARIHQEVVTRSEAGTGEACGLWIGDEVRNMKMGLVLTQCVIIMAKLLKLKSVFVLTSQYSIKMTKQCGFTPIKNLGNNGTFVYPTDQYTSTVSVNDDISGLSTVAQTQKTIINHLSTEIEANLIETTEKGPIILEYNFSEVLS